MDIIIFGNSYQGAYAEELRRFFGALDSHPDWRVRIESSYRYYLCAMIPEAVERFAPLGDDREIAGADMVFSIGGDGTFLHTANRIGSLEVPVMGINSGRLGYLSAAPLGSTDTVEAVAAGEYVVEPRTMLGVSGGSSRLQSRPYALNEAAILRQDTGSMISVDTFVNGTPLAEYQGDGLVISTPTGSTAYNLSAGGPIMAPDTSGLVITPIAPHSLNMRPLVVSDSAVIEVVPRGRSATFTLSLDGRARPLPVGTRLRIARAPFVTRLVRLRDHTFADTLRGKLLWGISTR